MEVEQPTAEVAAVLAVKTLPEVIEGLRAWIMGILAAVATLFLVIGGLRYMTAAGDPAGVEQAKGGFKAALLPACPLRWGPCAACSSAVEGPGIEPL